MCEELYHIADALIDKFKKFDSSGLHKIVQVCEEIGRSWSGSCIGYHSRVYYKDLIPVPTDAHFNREWGFLNKAGNDTVGDWVEYDSGYIVSVIVERAGNIDLDAFEKTASVEKDCFEKYRNKLLTILSTVLERHGENKFIIDVMARIKKEKIYGAFEFAQQLTSIDQQMSRDVYAVQAGVQIPPHILMMAKAKSFLSSSHSCEKLGEYAKRSASFIENLGKNQGREERIEEKIVIGYGQSKTWKDLKDFLHNRLQLPLDEFDFLSVGSGTNRKRLSRMLNEAAFAFLIMTAEDEKADTRLQHRMNIAHTVGLFQGRLGFHRVIVLLEEGCEEFSNIAGIDQIKFPKWKIYAIFEDIRQVLKRENIIG